MESSIKNILKYIFYAIIAIIVTIGIFGFILKCFDKTQIENYVYNDGYGNGYGISSREMDITILDDKILYEDNIIFNLNNPSLCSLFFFPDKEYLTNVNASINGETNMLLPSSLRMYLPAGIISLNKQSLNFLGIEDNSIVIQLVYEVEKDYIEKHSNTYVLHIFSNSGAIDYIKNFKVNLKSKELISNLVVDNATITKTNDTYNINIDKLPYGSNVDLRFDSNIDTNNVKKSRYLTEEETNVIEKKEEYDEYIAEKKVELYLWICLSLVIFLVVLVNNKRKRVKAYKIEFSELISPILAEAVVDGNIGLKELIMTSIIELHIKGNIKIINNDTIELISTDNLEKYEKEIINILFVNNTLKIDDINNIFVYSNSATLVFSENLNRIKKMILEKISSMNLVSKKLTLLNKVIKFIAIFICINMLRILSNDFGNSFDIFGIISIFAFLVYIKAEVNGNTIQEEMIKGTRERRKGKKSGAMAFAIMLLVIPIIRYILEMIIYEFLFVIVVLMIIFLNICTMRLCKNIVLTKYGKYEKNKLLNLKQYIINYSLIKNRDLNSTIIWDEYLAYAVAFGIPNKITEQIYEKWYNLNLNLQVFENILK